MAGPCCSKSERRAPSRGRHGTCEWRQGRRGQRSGGCCGPRGHGAGVWRVPTRGGWAEAVQWSQSHARCLRGRRVPRAEAARGLPWSVASRGAWPALTAPPVSSVPAGEQAEFQQLSEEIQELQQLLNQDFRQKTVPGQTPDHPDGAFMWVGRGGRCGQRVKTGLVPSHRAPYGAHPPPTPGPAHSVVLWSCGLGSPCVPSCCPQTALICPGRCGQPSGCLWEPRVSTGRRCQVSAGDTAVSV